MNSAMQVNVGGGENGDSISDRKKQEFLILKIFGGIHIGIGSLCAISSIAGSAMIGSLLNRDRFADIRHMKILRCGLFGGGSCLKYQVFKRVYGMSIACAVLSFLFIGSGIFPWFITMKNKLRWRALKIAFMVTCIISAVLISGFVFIAGCIGSVAGGLYEEDSIHGLLTGVIVLAAFEFIMAIVASSYCCCCSHDQGPGVIAINNANFGAIQNQPQQPQLLPSSQSFLTAGPGFPQIQQPGSQHFLTGVQGIQQTQQEQLLQQQQLQQQQQQQFLQLQYQQQLQTGQQLTGLNPANIPQTQQLLMGYSGVIPQTQQPMMDNMTGMMQQMDTLPDKFQ